MKKSKETQNARNHETRKKNKKQGNARKQNNWIKKKQGIIKEQAKENIKDMQRKAKKTKGNRLQKKRGKARK